MSRQPLGRAQRRNHLAIGGECQLRRVGEREIANLVQVVAGAERAAGDGAAKPDADG